MAYLSYYVNLLINFYFYYKLFLYRSFVFYVAIFFCLDFYSCSFNYLLLFIYYFYFLYKIRNLSFVKLSYCARLSISFLYLPSCYYEVPDFHCYSRFKLCISNFSLDIYFKLFYFYFYNFLYLCS